MKRAVRNPEEEEKRRENVKTGINGNNNKSSLTTERQLTGLTHKK